MSFINGDRVRNLNNGSVGEVTYDNPGYGNDVIGVDFGGGEQLVYKYELELLPKEEARKLDLEKAEKLLKRHGYAFRIYGAEDVHNWLDRYGPFNEVDTVTHRDEITKHVMEGDDWPELSNRENSDDADLLILNMIMGTNHDHHEWFPSL